LDWNSIQNLKEVEADIKLSNEKNIDEDRLKEAITDDLLQEKLFVWLEENNTVVEKLQAKVKIKARRKVLKRKQLKQIKKRKVLKHPNPSLSQID